MDDKLEILMQEVMGIRRTLNIIRQEVFQRTAVASVVWTGEGQDISMEIISVQESPSGLVIRVR